MLEGRDFVAFTDHKPLISALRSASDKYSPREIRHLDYVTQFTHDIRHVSGAANPVADALSRITAISEEEHIDLSAIAAAQVNDPDLTGLRCSSSLRLVEVPIDGTDNSII